MKTSSISLTSLAVLALAWPAMAQTLPPAETILPAILPPASQASMKAPATTAAPTPVAPAPSPATVAAPVPARGVVVNPTPTRPAVSAPHATLISDNTAPKLDQTVHYYLPVGAISPQSGIRTYPGNTAAHITNGSTRSSSGIPAGSTFARLAGSNGSRATRPSTKATPVHTR